MAAAALTPRVRIMVVCDEATASDTEDGVFALEGVRQRIQPRSLPCRQDLQVYLLLGCPRRGRYAGTVGVVSSQTERTVRWAPFDVTFGEASDLLPVIVDVFNCPFPEAGAYTFEIWFTTRSGDAAQ